MCSRFAVSFLPGFDGSGLMMFFSCCEEHDEQERPLLIVFSSMTIFQYPIWCVWTFEQEERRAGLVEGTSDGGFLDGRGDVGGEAETEFYSQVKVY